MPAWTFPAATPVIAPGVLHPAYDCRRAAAPHVVAVPGGYRMIYWGSDSQGRHYLLRADSPAAAPNAWRPWGTPLLGPQPDTDHNAQGPAFPFLLPLTDSHWLLYFTAWGIRADGRLPNTTGLAFTHDAGHSWHYHSDHPILPLDREYDGQGTGSVWVLRQGDRFRMYYTAIGHYFPRPPGVATGHGDTIPHIGIAYAESADGIHWHKPLAGLLIAPRGHGVAPYEYIVSKPCIVSARGHYQLWVNTFGTAYRVHRLTSPDGAQWHWAPRPGPDGELGTGAPGCFDDHQRSYPTVIAADDRLHCWFTGNTFGTTGIGYATAALPSD